MPEENNKDIDVQYDCNPREDAGLRGRGILLFAMLFAVLVAGIVFVCVYSLNNSVFDVRAPEVLHPYDDEPIEIVVLPEDEMAAEPQEYPECKPNQWIIDKTVSTLSFEATQYGQKFQGSFEFDGEIIFNPEDLGDASVLIEIDVNSIATGSLNRDEKARTDEWFDVQNHPIATFKADSFTKGEEEGAYIAHGRLNLHGVDVSVELPFSLRFYGDESLDDGKNEMAKNRVEMTGQLLLNRSSFGIGSGEWRSDDVIGDNVEVFVLLHAYQPAGLNQ